MANMNPVGWFEIYVQDISRAQKFYETVLDLGMSELPLPPGDELKMIMFTAPDAANMARPGSTGALVQMPGFPSGANSTIVYFMSADCSIEESRVKAAGGDVFKTKFSIGPHGFISLCKDTEGNMFGIHSMK